MKKEQRSDQLRSSVRAQPEPPPLLSRASAAQQQSGLPLPGPGQRHKTTQASILLSTDGEGTCLHTEKTRPGRGGRQMDLAHCFFSSPSGRGETNSTRTRHTIQPPRQEHTELFILQYTHNKAGYTRKYAFFVLKEKRTIPPATPRPKQTKNATQNARTSVSKRANPPTGSANYVTCHERRGFQHGRGGGERTALLAA